PSRRTTRRARTPGTTSSNWCRSSGRRSPTFPMDEVVHGLAGLREAAGEAVPVGVVRRLADGDAAGDVDVVRYVEQRLERCDRLDEHAEEPGCVALVDGGEQNQHRGGTGVEVPVRDRPFDLAVVDQLVR